MEIAEILKKYDTDKETHHRYGKIYQELFERFGRNDKLNILEIGTQKGGSLLAWKEYFPLSSVMGVDIVDVVSPEYKTDSVIRIIGDIKELRFDYKFDIVIDDGSHYLADLVFTVSEFWPKIKKGGVLVLEDIRHPDLMKKVIENLFSEFGLGHPDFEQDGECKVKFFDNRIEGADYSYIIALAKE